MKLIFFSIFLLFIIQIESSKNRLYNRLKSTNETAAAGGNSSNSSKPQVKDEILPDNDFEVKKCNNVVKATGDYIKDLYNYTDRAPMVLVTNVWTISLFGKDDPTSLIKSIDVVHISRIHNITGAPGCWVIEAPKENKTLIPCFPTKQAKKDFKQALRKFEECRMGSDLQGKSKLGCDDDDDDDEEDNKKKEKGKGEEKKEEGGAAEEEGTSV